MGRQAKKRSYHFETVELRARMIQETEDYLTVRLPGRDVQWLPDHNGRSARIGQRARQWVLGEIQPSRCRPSTEPSFG